MTSSSYPVVGREDERALLAARLTGLSDGTGGCVVLEGPPGIGKSRLLADSVREARRLDLAVAAGKAVEADRVAPLAAFTAALRGSTPPVIRDGELADLGGSVDSRHQLVDRLAERLGDYARARPQLIVLDDAQWMDELTALALRVLIPGLSELPVLWLLARRPWPAQTHAVDTLGWLEQEHALVRRLTPLGDAAVAELCANLLGREPGPGVLALARDTGGNPFLLEQLLTSLRADDRIRVEQGRAELLPGSLPDGFVAAVEHRLRALAPDTRRMLEAGSVFGRPFTLHAVAGLLERPALELTGAAREAVTAGMLEDRGSALAFRHDLLREAVYDSLAGPVRQALHREAVSVLRSEGYPVAEVAEHYLRGAQRADAKALLLLDEALAEVAPNAPGAAADLILRALDLLAAGDRRRLRLIGEAVRLLASSGRMEEARRLGETYLSCGLEPAAEGSILLGLSEALKHTGQDREVAEYTWRGLARAGVPIGVRARLLAVRAHALMQVDDVAGAETTAAQAVQLGRAASNAAAVVSGLAARGFAQYARGDLAAAVGYAREAVRAADDAGGEARHQHPRLWLGRALVAADEPGQAAAALAADQREAEQLGTLWSRPVWHYFTAEAALAAGRLEQARTEAEAGVRLAAEQLRARALLPALLATLGYLALQRGDVENARDHLRRARRCTEEEGICTASALSRGSDFESGRLRTNASRSNRSHYRIAERLVTFYHAIMRPVWPELERSRDVHRIWQRARERYASNVLGPRFERVCREWTWQRPECSATSSTPAPATRNSPAEAAPDSPTDSPRSRQTTTTSSSTSARSTAASRRPRERLRTPARPRSSFSR